MVLIFKLTRVFFNEIVHKYVEYYKNTKLNEGVSACIKNYMNIDLDLIKNLMIWVVVKELSIWVVVEEKWYKTFECE